MTKFSEPFEVDGRWFYDVIEDGVTDRRGPYKSSTAGKQSITKRRNALRGGLRRNVEPPPPIRDYDGSLQWWGDILASAACQVYHHGTPDRCRQLNALASAAKAAHHIHDIAQIETDVRELQDYRDQMRAAKRHGIRDPRAA